MATLNSGVDNMGSPIFYFLLSQGHGSAPADRLFVGKSQQLRDNGLTLSYGKERDPEEVHQPESVCRERDHCRMFKLEAGGCELVEYLADGRADRGQ